MTPVEFGGSEKVNLTFFRQVNRKKIIIHPILLVRPWEEGSYFIKELNKADYSYTKVPVAIKPYSQGRDYLRFIRCIKIIYSELKKGRYDLVHTHGYFADIAGVIAAKLLRIPIVSTCHGFISNNAKLSIYNKLDIIALRFMSAIVAVSNKIKDDLVKEGINDRKIHVVQNAVELIADDMRLQQQRHSIRRKYAIKDEEIVLGYVGRLSEEKGLKYLVEAASSLAQSDVSFRLLVIGDGPQREEIKRLLQGTIVEKHVVFAGFQKDVTGMLSAFDIFVLPSLTEGTSMALLEAMVCGLPVVATAVGGTPKVIVSGQNGILVPAAEPEALVHAVLQLIEDEPLRNKLGNEAKKTIESDFSIKRWIGKVESIYSETIGKS